MAHEVTEPFSGFYGANWVTTPTSSRWLGLAGSASICYLTTEMPLPGGPTRFDLTPLASESGTAAAWTVRLRSYRSGSQPYALLSAGGGTVVEGNAVTTTGAAPIAPVWDVPAGEKPYVFLQPPPSGPWVLWGYEGLTSTVSGTAPAGIPVAWDSAATDAPRWLPGRGMSGQYWYLGGSGPWLHPENGASTLTLEADAGPNSTLTAPIHAVATTVTVRLTGSPTPVLVSAGGATDNGDGTVTVAPGQRANIVWSGCSGAVQLVLTKGFASGDVSYSPLYLDAQPIPPSITRLIPASGPDTGGTLVDVIGANLTGATAVDFGGTAGTGLTVDPSGNLATVTSPAHTAGPAPVTITTPAGTSAAETFTFEAPIPPGLPTLTGIDPTEGPETGGTTALLTGTNLTGTIGVDFGGSTATIITTTDTALLVTTPAHAAGTVDVTATDGATTTDPLAFEFTEATGPVIDGPDVIANLVALLTSELGVPVSSRRSPTATKDSDPSVVVRRTGGPSKGVASDNPTVTIEAWAPTTTESFQLLQSARLVVIEAAEQGRAGLRRYDEFAGPADLPDPSTTNPRHTLTASVVTRIE